MSLTHGANFVLSTEFDASMDAAVEAPFVGSGVLTFDAEEALGDGAYGWESFDNLQLSLVFDEVTFTEEDLRTPVEEVFIEVRGGNFFFSNFYGYGEDVYGGASLFQSGEYVLTTQAYQLGGGPLFGFGGVDNPGYFIGSSGAPEPLYGGTYGVIPEPSSVAVMLGAGAMAGVLAVRRRRK